MKGQTKICTTIYLIKQTVFLHTMCKGIEPDLILISGLENVRYDEPILLY